MCACATEEQTNFARLSRITIDLLPEVLRDLMFSIIDPSSTQPKYFATVSNGWTKGRKKLLGPQQLTIINGLHSAGNYNSCDTSLLYILIRNLNGGKICPTNGWDKAVGHNIDRGDDIERIREMRNKLFGHTTAAEISNNDYRNFINDVTDVLTRFDTQHNGTYPTYAGIGTYVAKLQSIKMEYMDKKMYDYYTQQLQNLVQVEKQMEKRIEDLELGQEKTKHDQYLFQTAAKAKFIALEMEQGTSRDEVDTFRTETKVKFTSLETDHEALRTEQDTLKERITGIEMLKPESVSIGVAQKASRQLKMLMKLKLGNKFHLRRFNDTDIEVNSDMSNLLLDQVSRYFSEDLNFGDKIDIFQCDSEVKHSFFRGTSMKFKLHYIGVGGFVIPHYYYKSRTDESKNLQCSLREIIKKRVFEEWRYSVGVTFPGWYAESLVIIMSVFKKSGEKWYKQEFTVMEEIIRNSTKYVDNKIELDSCDLISHCQEDSNDNCESTMPGLYQEAPCDLQFELMADTSHCQYQEISLYEIGKNIEMKLMGQYDSTFPDGGLGRGLGRRSVDNLTIHAGMDLQSPRTGGLDTELNGETKMPDIISVVTPTEEQLREAALRIAKIGNEIEKKYAQHMDQLRSQLSSYISTANENFSRNVNGLVAHGDIQWTTWVVLFHAGKRVVHKTSMIATKINHYFQRHRAHHEVITNNRPTSL